LERFRLRSQPLGGHWGYAGFRKASNLAGLIEMLEIPRKPAIASAFYEAWGGMSRRRLCEGGYVG